ncbi:MAG TPA: hypothetical protein VLF20_06140, partial [Patescibacteria group bacterium]|nr:hypothetical protein [Patescibacteria group bacterium]
VLKKNSKIIIFWAAWLVPGLLYNLFIRTEHAGYQMSYLTGLLILISYAIWRTTKKSIWLFVTVLTIIALFNLYWFFYDRDPEYAKPYRPTSFHYSDIKKNDVKTGSKVSFVRKNFDPQSTLIVSTEVLWRPYSYYLPEYHYVVLFRLDNTVIPYSYNKIASQKIDMQWSQEEKFILTIPKNVTKIVFMDDSTQSWIKNYPFKTHHLPGNSVITEISVQPEDKLFYNYHEIIIQQPYQ